MNKVFLKKAKTTVLIAILCIITGNANASIIPNVSLPDREILDFLESGPSWLPKPYKTPINQGTLIENENLQQLIPGLSKKQVEFLLGTPAIIDSFHSNRWDYVYYDRIDGKLSKPKRLVVIFKNEKVSEIYDQHKLVNKMGLDMPNGFADAPILEKDGNQSEMLYQEIVIARREDFLSLRKIIIFRCA